MLLIPLNILFRGKKALNVIKINFLAGWVRWVLSFVKCFFTWNYLINKSPPFPFLEMSWHVFLFFFWEKCWHTRCKWDMRETWGRNKGPQAQEMNKWMYKFGSGILVNQNPTFTAFMWKASDKWTYVLIVFLRTILRLYITGYLYSLIARTA